MELATPGFIPEFDTRPNRLFFEYLRYPREVFGTLLTAQPMYLLGVTTVLRVFIVTFHRFGSHRMQHASEWSLRSHTLSCRW